MSFVPKRAFRVGYGNIGRYVIEALSESTDFEIAGIVRRDCNHIPDELKSYHVTSSLADLDADVAILAPLLVKSKNMRCKHLHWA